MQQRFRNYGGGTCLLSTNETAQEILATHKIRPGRLAGAIINDFWQMADIKLGLHGQSDGTLLYQIRADLDFWPVAGGAFSMQAVLAPGQTSHISQIATANDLRGSGYSTAAVRRLFWWAEVLDSPTIELNAGNQGFGFWSACGFVPDNPSRVWPLVQQYVLPNVPPEHAKIIEKKWAADRPTVMWRFLKNEIMKQGYRHERLQQAEDTAEQPTPWGLQFMEAVGKLRVPMYVSLRDPETLVAVWSMIGFHAMASSSLNMRFNGQLGYVGDDPYNPFAPRRRPNGDYYPLPMPVSAP